MMKLGGFWQKILQYVEKQNIYRKKKKTISVLKVICLWIYVQKKNN